MPPDPVTLRRALVFGGSGLVGRAVIDQLLANPLYLSVTAMVRRPIPEFNPRLVQRGLDFEFLGSQTIAEIDDVYCCLGTTIRIAGSRDAFHKVDYQYVMIAASAGLRSGAKRFAIVTAAGANARSRIFYNRVKGEVEGEMMQMGYGSLVIARPSFLIGDRKRLSQAERTGEGWALRTVSLLSPILPSRVRAIPATTVARALMRTMIGPDAPVRILESDELARVGQLRYW